MSTQLTITELIRIGESKLKDISDTPYLDAEILFAYASGLSRVHIIAESHTRVSEEIYNRFGALVERRSQREPVAYIIGEKEFWSLSFSVSPDVLIPRPETELLVEEVCAYAQRFNGRIVTIADIGTGSGCIAVAVAVELKKRDIQSNIIATDLSEAALAVAKQNAQRHDVSQIVTFRHGDLFTPLSDLKGAIDIVVSNPPYIELGDPDVDIGTHEYEPHSALYAREQGLQAISTLMKEFLSYCSKDGALIFEFGSKQHDAISKRAKEFFDDSISVSFRNDYAGLARICTVSHKFS